VITLCSTPAASPAAQEACRPLHARDGREDLRHAQGPVLKVATSSPRRGSGAAERSCTRSGDAALGGRPDDPRGGHAAAPLGNVGPAGGGVNALRGIRTSRARRTWPAPSRSCPATWRRRARLTRLEDVYGEVTPTTLTSGLVEHELLVEHRNHVSLLKATYGKGAPRRRWGYEWLPKTDRQLFGCISSRHVWGTRSARVAPSRTGFITFGMTVGNRAQLAR